MKIYAYSIYDNKALTYSAPMYHPADGAACRMLSDLVQSNDTHIARHPMDFGLFKVGVFETETGAFEAYMPLVHVADASEFIRVQPEFPADLFKMGNKRGDEEAL